MYRGKKLEIELYNEQNDEIDNYEKTLKPGQTI